MNNCSSVSMICRQQDCGLVWGCLFFAFIMNIWQCGIRQRDKRKIKYLERRFSFLETLTEDIAEEVIIPEAEIVEEESI